jgi:hypothetical protein
MTLDDLGEWLFTRPLFEVKAMTTAVSKSPNEAKVLSLWE